MPIVTAEKAWMQVARAPHIGIAFHHMIELVRIFARHMAERGLREAAGGIQGQVHSRNAPT